MPTASITEQLSEGKQQISSNTNQFSNGNYVYQITGITKSGQVFRKSKRLIVSQKK